MTHDPNPRLMAGLTAADRTVSLLSRWFGYAGMAGLFAIMVMTVADVVSRTVTDSGLSGVIEFSELLLVIGVFLGFALAQQARAHVATSLVVDRLPERVSRAVQATGLAAVAALLAWASVAAVDKALGSLESGEVRIGLVEVPLWPGRMAMAVGLVLLLLEVLVDIAALLLGRKRIADIPGANDENEVRP